MERLYDAIVVGVGSMGSSACWRLAQRGARVLGLEQFDIPHGRGSHHGYSRMIRLAYYEHPDYVPLLRRAYEGWDELERATGQQILHVTGGLYMGPPDGEIVAGSLAAARTHGLRHELLEQRDLQTRFPQFAVPPDWTGFLEPQAGLLLPERAVSAFAGEALRRGAELHGHEPVLHWEADRSGVRVTTARDSYRGRRLVFTAGAWTSRLLSGLGVPLTVTRQALAWFWPRDPAPFALGTLPCWFLETGRGCGHYGFPLLPESPGFKIALHQPGPVTDPDRDPREARPEDEEALRPVLRRHIPGADGPLLASRVCLYTNSPDHHFILDRHPEHPEVTVAAGFSGHGFKFASVIGEILADLALQGRSELPCGFLGLSRFA